MRVLFLDIDGVLNSDPFWFEKINQHGRMEALHNPHLVVQGELVQRLQGLLDQVEVKVVLSSNWRLGIGLKATEEALRKHGFTHSLYDQTPILYPEKMSKYVTRGEEINKWLSLHEVDNYAIVDDREDMGHHTPRLVLTNSQVGITDENVSRLLELLTEE